jgi:pimeloyl-ACP methyl ester carboxylesterase
MEKKKNHSVIATTTAISFLLSLAAIIAVTSFPIPSTSLLPFALVADGQPERPLPVLLIHGYRSTHNVWDEWEDKLGQAGVYTKAVTFPRNDECGNATDHAIQLNKIVRDFKREARAEKINIVTHSKGGLDARVYLANNPSSDDVANLIMIATPNEGSPLADRYYRSDDCKPAVYDLITTSPVLRVEKNEHTRYHTISGNWISVYQPEFRPPFWWVLEDINCPNPSNWFDLEGWNFLTFQQNGRYEITGPDDGIVPLNSVEEPGEFRSLGRTNNCHTNMFTDEEYSKAIGVLLGLV